MNKPDTNHSKTRWTEQSLSGMWWLITTSIAAALILGLGTLEVIRLLALPLAVFIFGLTLAAALDPVISWLERRLPRLLAVILTHLLLVTLLGGLVWAIVPALVDQVQYLVSRIPDLTERAREFLDRWDGTLSRDSFINTVITQLSSLGLVLLSLPLTLTAILSGILLILFISLYILLEAPQIQSAILSLFPEKRRGDVNEVFLAMTQAAGGYFRGVAINGVIVGFLTFSGLLLLGIDFPLVFGVIAGILELIPVVGPIIAGLIIVGLTLLQSPGEALAALVFMIVLQQLENQILVPNIMRNQTKVSPLLSILAIFAGGAIGGVMGALIAIPVAAALRVLFIQVIAPAIRRQTGAEPPELDPQ